MHPRIILVLPDIRSVFNIASIFRTADAAGVEEILLAGFTPGPLDRFGRPRRDFAKVALGAEANVPWERVPDLPASLRELKRAGYSCVALEQTDSSRDYRSFNVPQRTVLLVGNETAGLPEELVREADAVVHIPLYGKKESLNVEVALGIALFSLVSRSPSRPTRPLRREA